MNLSINSTTASVRQIVSTQVQISIPLFYNLRTKITVTCVDNKTNQQYANIKSFKVISLGQNIDGLSNEYNKSLIPTVYNTTVLNAQYYKDTAILDLGIITNTGFTTIFLKI